MKQLSAILAALVITFVIGFGVLVIGVSAFTNKNTVAVQDAPSGLAEGSIDNIALASGLSTDVQQLQQQVGDLQFQLDQANQTIEQYQGLLIALQQRGVISISQDGRIFIPHSESSSDHD